MNILLISLTVIGVSCQIETNHGCKTGCDCPDFSGLIMESSLSYTYTKMDGCTFKLSCLDGNTAGLDLFWKGSEIEKPWNMFQNNFITFIEGSAPVPSVDFLSTYGIVCENGTWFASKYNHTVYSNLSWGFTEIPAETINGKKSPIRFASW